VKPASVSAAKRQLLHRVGTESSTWCSGAIAGCAPRWLPAAAKAAAHWAFGTCTAAAADRPPVALGRGLRRHRDALAGLASANSA
jgi:hypothetical protein